MPIVSGAPHWQSQNVLVSCWVIGDLTSDLATRRDDHDHTTKSTVRCRISNAAVIQRVIQRPICLGFKSRAVVSGTRSNGNNVSRALLSLPMRCCFSGRPLTDRDQVEQLAVRGTCVFPLVWRVCVHNTGSSFISRSQTLQRQVWTG